MTLTVPFAGTDAGRAARIPVEASDTGNVIAAFGEQMAQVGGRIEADRLDREMRRLQVDMTRDLGDLRLKAEEIGDPDQLDTFWQEGIAGLKQSYLTGQTETGRPRVDPKIAEDWQIGFDDLANRHGHSLGQTALALRQSQRIATFADYEHVAGQQAALVDPDTRDKLYADYDAQVDAMAARGILTPEAAAEKKRGFREGIESAQLTTLIAEDPEAVIDGIEGGIWPGLDAGQQAQWKTRAEAAVAASAEKAQKDAEVAAREEAARIKADLTETIAIVGKGRASSLEALADDPAAIAAHPALVAELRGATALRDQKIFIDQMTPAELEALSERLAGETVTKKWQTEAKDVVDARLAAAKTELGRDPIAYAQSVDLPVPVLDLSTPEKMTETLAARATFGKWLAEKGYTDKPAVLTLDEQATLKAMIDPKGGTSPAERAAIARTLALTIGETSPAALADLAPDPAFRHVGSFLVAGGNDALATEILKGQEEIARKTVVMPPLNQRAAPFFATIGGLFTDLPQGGGAAKEAVFATADALYAARNSLDPEGEVDADAYAQATHEALGGTGRYGSGDATGGIQEVNGQMTFMPMGLSSRRTDAAIGMIADALDDAPALGAAEKPRFKAASEIISTASAGGNLPVVNGSYMTAEDWQSARFIATGNDRYELAIEVGDTWVKALDATSGDPFVFSLTRLTDGAERARKVLTPSRTAPETLGAAP